MRFKLYPIDSAINRKAGLPISFLNCRAETITLNIYPSLVIRGLCRIVVKDEDPRL